jgi:hypothetical protein
MVNKGRSGGCNTCRRRRVKCDETRPACQACQRGARECEGYDRPAPGLKFRDQSTKYGGKPKPARNPPKLDDGQGLAKDNTLTPEGGSCQSPAVLDANQGDPDETQKALSFFLTYVAGGGRNVTSSRGFFEVIEPAMADEPEGSPLRLAVVAVATKLWGMIQLRENRVPHPPFVSACRRLQAAIEDPVEKTREGTVMAALVLQFYENLSAVFGLQRAEHTHFAGAGALLNVHAVAGVESKYRSFIIGDLLHTEVSHAIRSKARVSASMYSWLQGDLLATMQKNLSMQLDMIGVSVAHHQHRFAEFVPMSSSISTSFVLEEWWAEIRETEFKLHQWLEIVPDSWQPTRRWAVHDLDPSIFTFSGACDIYPSAQVASIWNVFRGYRLILLKIKLALLHIKPSLATVPRVASSWGFAAVATEDANCYDHEVSCLVDFICNSVPFYLGNNTEPLQPSHFESDRVIFPSYHDLPREDEAFVRYLDSGHSMTREIHKGHLLTQGPWHVMSPLAHLLSLFSEDFGDLLVRSLHPGQREWIRSQVIRVATLFHLTPEFCATILPTNPDMMPSVTADIIARTIREGLRMTSGT